MRTKWMAILTFSFTNKLFIAQNTKFQADLEENVLLLFCVQ